MKTYLVTLELGNDIADHIIVHAENTVEVMEKITAFCKEDGWYPIGIKIQYTFDGKFTELI